MFKKHAKRVRNIHRRIRLAYLKQIRKNKTPRYTHCKNCGTLLEGMYCYRCGQYALDTEQPFWKYIRQYFENVYQFDTKIWRTLWYMFTRPGFLTTEFNKGKINAYVHPFRLYMCISVVFFAVFFMLVGERVNDVNAMDDGLLKQDIVEQAINSPYPADTLYTYQAPRLIKTLSLRFGMKNADTLIRYQPVDDPYGLARVIMPRLLADSCFRQSRLTQQDWNFIQQAKNMKNLNIENWIDGKNYGPENVAAIQAFRIDSTYTTASNGADSLILQPQPVFTWTNEADKDAEIDILQKEQFSNGLIGSLSKWTPFFMMFLLPLFAAMLQLFYRHKRMPYMWHFVHAIHLNTVFLILLCIPLIPFFAYGIDDIVATRKTLSTIQENFMYCTIIGFPIAMLLYMLMSFRTVYRQGWLKTTVKTVLFFTTFTLIASLTASALLLWLLVKEAEVL